MNAVDARALPDVRLERASRWGGKAVIPVFVIVLVAAGVTWVNVVRTIRHPDPLSIPDRPQIAGIMWSNRVFIHERALKRWLEARGRSYVVWARKHPRAVAVLRDRPLSRPRQAASRNAPRTAASAPAPAASNDVGLVALAVLGGVFLAAIALLLGPARRVVLGALDRTSEEPPLDARPRGRRSRHARERLADAFEDAVQSLSDHRTRVAAWMLVVLVAAAGLTFLLSQ